MSALLEQKETLILTISFEELSKMRKFSATLDLYKLRLIRMLKVHGFRVDMSDSKNGLSLINFDGEITEHKNGSLTFEQTI